MRAKMIHFCCCVCHLQLSFRRLRVQRMIQLEYAFLRLQREHSRLKLFYFSKAKELKHASKMYNSLEALSFTNEAQRSAACQLLASYRKYKAWIHLEIYFELKSQQL